MKRTCLFWLILLYFSTPSLADDISVTATVQPDVVPVGGEATLVVRVEGKFRKSSQPQIPELDGLSVYEAGTSQSFSIVNGRTNSSLQFTYVIVGNEEGHYKIDPITFEVGDKTYTASPVEIEVVKAASQLPAPALNPDEPDDDTTEDRAIFIRATVDRDTVYVNQQVTWTLGFFTDGRANLLRSPEYSPPASEGFWVEDLPPHNNYYRMVGGKKYLVNEIKRGLFPTAPGDYTIGAARVDIVIDDFGRRSVDDFFNRNLRSFGFGKHISLSTDEIKVTVLPLPTAGRPGNFTGLVGKGLELSVRADKQVVQVGDPVNVTVEITGQGNFKAMAAPEIPELDGFKVYESGSSSELFKKDYIVSGRKKSEYVLVPKAEGHLTLPAIRMSYFDPVERRFKTIQSTPIQMDVKPGTQEEGRRIVFTGSGEDIEVLGRDINYIRPVPSTITGVRRFYTNNVLLALHALPLLAVVVSLVAERRRRRWLAQGPRARALRALREAERRLERARRQCQEGQSAGAYSSVAVALREFFADKMNESASGLTDAKIEEFMRQAGAGDDAVSGVRNVLRDCDGAQYSGAAANSVERAQDAVDRATAIVRDVEKRYFAE